MWLLGICSTLVNLKAVIFPHKNYYNYDNNKNNRSDSGYDGDSMISRLILYACLTLRTATYGNGFSLTAAFFLGVDAELRGYGLPENEAKGGGERAHWELQRHKRHSEDCKFRDVSLIFIMAAKLQRVVPLKYI